MASPIVDMLPENRARAVEQHAPPCCPMSPATLPCLAPAEEARQARPSDFINPNFRARPNARYEALLGSVYSGAVMSKSAAKARAMATLPLPMKTRRAPAASMGGRSLLKRAARARQKSHP